MPTAHPDLESFVAKQAGFVTFPVITTREHNPGPEIVRSRFGYRVT